MRIFALLVVIIGFVILCVLPTIQYLESEIEFDPLMTYSLEIVWNDYDNAEMTEAEVLEHIPDDLISGPYINADRRTIVQVKSLTSVWSKRYGKIHKAAPKLRRQSFPHDSARADDRLSTPTNHSGGTDRSEVYQPTVR